MLTAVPMIALANNSDMIRVQACIGAYPVRDSIVPAWSNNPRAPIGSYRFLSTPMDSCFYTSELVFAFMAKPLMRIESWLTEDGTFSIRWVGFVKLSVILILAWSISIFWLYKKNNLAALLNAVIVAAVLMDPANTIYLNGFYAEFSTVIFAYAVLAGSMVLMQGGSGFLIAIFVGVAVVGLTTSKVQHAMAGIAILIALLSMTLTGFVIQKKLLISLFIAALLGLAIQITYLKHHDLQVMRLVNMTNVVFMTIMPLSEDPAALVKHLDLPEDCGKYSGLSWWLPPVSQKIENHPCREVADVSYFRLIKLIFNQPVTMLRLVGGGMAHLRPWLGNRTYDGVIYLGVVEGGDLADLPDGWFSWSRVLDFLSPLQFALFLMLPAFLLPAIFYHSRLGRRQLSLDALLVMLVFLGASTYISILMGNGYMDTAKVANLMINSLLSFWILGSMAFVFIISTQVCRICGFICPESKRLR